MSPSPVPVTRVEVEITEACNLSCQFCYNSRQPSNSSCVIRVFDALKEARVLEVVLTGGEPSLHPDFLQLLDAAIERFPRVMVQSNGVRFAEGMLLSELVSRRVFCLNFSLHGPERVHDALTRYPGSYRATIRALGAAVQAGIRTASNLVLTRLNARPDALADAVSTLECLGVREMTITRFVPCGLGREAFDLALSVQQIDEALTALQEETSKRGMSLLLANAVPVCKVPSIHRSLANRCSFGYDKFYVDVRGNLLVCGMTRQKVGNLLDVPLAALLTSSSVCSRYRENLHLPAECRTCDDLPSCGGGCRAAALAAHGSLEGMDPLVFEQA